MCVYLWIHVCIHIPMCLCAKQGSKSCHNCVYAVQDTVLALQAISLYSMMVTQTEFTRPIDVSVDILEPSGHSNISYTLTQDNMDILRIEEVGVVLFSAILSCPMYTKYCTLKVYITKDSILNDWIFDDCVLMPLSIAFIDWIKCFLFTASR